jgi:hypothetical protein
VQAQARRPQRPRLALEAQTREQRRALFPESPRTFGKPPSLWTPRLAAEVGWARGLTPYHVSLANIRHARKRLGVSWPRATHWLTSPAPPYAREKSGGTG